VACRANIAWRDLSHVIIKGVTACLSPTTPKPPKWVFWSTRETIDHDVPSVTGIIETVIAVVAY
jgi:hypothetical protein